MMPMCFYYKKSEIGPGVADIKCTVDPTRELYRPPWDCPDKEPTENGEINYKKETK